MKQLWLRVSVIALVLVACSDSTKPVTPATIATISLTPTAIGVVKGSKTPLTLSAYDVSGNEVRNDASWMSSAPSVATVSGSGVVSGREYGSATIRATVGTATASATVIVTAFSTTKAYSVFDLGEALSIGGMTRQLSDSGDVIANGKLYHGGVLSPMTGCTTAVTINGPGDVLCRNSLYDSVSSYAIWHDGKLTRLAAVDTFQAEHFRAFAMNDSDEVAGLVFNPAFSNPNCSTAGARCLSIWKNGTVTFPGFNAGAELMLMNNTPQVVLQDPIYGEYHTSAAVIYDVASRQQRFTPYSIQALNDRGWAAIANTFQLHGGATSGLLVYTAEVATTGGLVELGPGVASGINNSNVVVGTLTIGPFIWRGQGVSLLTNAAIDPTWTITTADEINNRGQILATADNSDGRKAHTVILTPTQP